MQLGAEDQEQPAGASARAAGWATATPYRVPLALAAVGLVVSAPFGGWRAAAPDELALVAPGEQIEAAPFEITLERAYHSPRPSDSFPELEGNQEYVVVLGTATSRHTATVTSGLLTEALEVAGLPATHTPGGSPVEAGDPATGLLHSAQDSTRLMRLGPDLTYEFGLVLTSAAEEFPSELQVTVSSHTWREDAFSREPGWFTPTARATVTVPLTAQDEP